MKEILKYLAVMFVVYGIVAPWISVENQIFGIIMATLTISSSIYLLYELHKYTATKKNGEIEVQILNNLSKFSTPMYAKEGDSGMDIRYNGNKSLTINPFERQLISTGLFVAVPNGYEFQVRPRSGLALKEGITVLNTPGTVDSKEKINL